MRKTIKCLLVNFSLTVAMGVFADRSDHYQPSVDINQLFQQAIHDRAFPGGCLVAGTKDRIVFKKCFGYHSYEKKFAESVDDVFDLASMTKVIGTTTAVMKLYEQHKLRLSDKVVQYLPEFSGPDRLHTFIKSTLTIEDLLSHHSGLQDSNAVNCLPHDSLNQRWHCLYQTPLKYYPRRKMVYSDLNFILLGKIVERITGEKLDDYLKCTVFRPLEMQHTSFCPRESYFKIVPTYSTQIVGIVHDPIARSVGGVCGHAGLFSTVNDLQHFAQMMLNGGRYKNRLFLKEDTIEKFSHRDEVISGSTHALGWDTAYRSDVLWPQHQFSAGYYIDADAIGHTGYTGTSIWISRKHGLYVIMLTNRVFENPDPTDHARDRYWRQLITSAIWYNLGFTQKNVLYHEAIVH